jgi:nitrogen-specific signal transduction histidine kinase
MSADSRDPRANNPEGVGQPTEINFDEFLNSLPKEAQDRVKQEIERARLNGAMLVSRTVAHVANNRLSGIVGYSEMLSNMPQLATILTNIPQAPTAAHYARFILEEAEALADKVRVLQHPEEFTIVPSPLGPDMPILDLDKPKESE